MTKDELAAALAIVRRSRVYFYHHSVGRNVLDGIERLTVEAAEPALRMPSLDDPIVPGPMLIHGGRGRNGDPTSKVDAFATAIREELRPGPELAFMKFCYVDFNPSTNVDALFDHYSRTLESLKRERPEIRFAHVTVPLMTRPVDLKSSVRRLLGLQVWEDAANAKRSEFNKRLVEAFAGDPLFDLARIESTAPDGSATTFEFGGRRVPSLSPAYTDDGGHLNAAGQRVASAAAIRFLAGALSRTAVTP